MISRAFIFLFSFLLVIACEDGDDSLFEAKGVTLTTHRLMSYSVIKNSGYIVVFESGLGDDHKVWDFKSVATRAASISDVVTYDRAGYGKSEKGPSPRDIQELSLELAAVVDFYGEEAKIVLVGHSLGGMIVRDYAIRHPSRVAAILFVDPSHELYNDPTQQVEDQIYNEFKRVYGTSFGGTMEARYLVEDTDYMNQLENLPDVPVTVLTSMKTDGSHNAADRQRWFDAHEAMKQGITDFQHITTKKSGHYIMLDEPDLVITQLKALLAKLS